MLNLVTYDITDQSLLEKSYNAIKDKDSVEFVSEGIERENIFRKTINSIRIGSVGSPFLVHIKSIIFHLILCVQPIGRSVAEA